MNAVSVLIGCAYRQFSRFQLSLLEQHMASRQLSLFIDEIGSLSIYNSDGEFALPQTSSPLFHLVQIENLGEFFLCQIQNDLNNCIIVLKEKKENRFLMFTSSLIQRKTRKFQVVVVKQRQRNVPKSVLHVQSGCFAFFLFSLPLP